MHCIITIQLCNRLEKHKFYLKHTREERSELSPKCPRISNLPQYGSILNKISPPKMCPPGDQPVSDAACCVIPIRQLGSCLTFALQKCWKCYFILAQTILKLFKPKDFEIGRGCSGKKVCSLEGCGQTISSSQVRLA